RARALWRRGCRGPRARARGHAGRRSSREVLGEAEVTLARVAEHGEHALARAELAREVERDRNVRARADADEQPLAIGEPQLHLPRPLVGHGADLVDYARVVVLGHEARVETLDLARADG